MPVVVDTNVLIAANGRDCPQSTPACQLTCIQRLNTIRQQDTIVIDNRWRILREYQYKVSPTGQPGVGDAFLKWVLTNQGNPAHCQQVAIIETSEGSFQEFPNTPALQGFDPSDHKFVAVALTHPAHPPILNAVDSDWQIFAAALTEAGVSVQQLCP